MEQLIYLAGSIAGIAAIVGLNVALFGRAKEALPSLEAAGQRLALEIPGFVPGDGVLAAGGAAALLADRSQTYLVLAKGDGMVARRLGPGALADLNREGAVLELKLADFTVPRLSLPLADEDSAGVWEARLKNSLKGSMNEAVP